MLFKFIGERLFDVEDGVEDAWVFSSKAIENVVHIGRLRHGAIEVSRQIFSAVLHPDSANVDDALEVPLGVVSTQLDLEAFQAVAPDPIGQQYWIPIGRLLSGQLQLIEGVESAHQMPRGKFVQAPWQQKVVRVFSREGNGDVRRSDQESAKITRHEFSSVCF